MEWASGSSKADQLETGGGGSVKSSALPDTSLKALATTGDMQIKMEEPNFCPYFLGLGLLIILLLLNK